MDIFISMLSGLFLRALLPGSANPSLQTLSLPFLGLWEAIVLTQLAPKSASLDHYLAFGLRLVIDILLTQSSSRQLVVVLWTALGILIIQITGPNPRDRSHHRRHKSIRKPLQQPRVRVYEVPADQSQLLPLFPPEDATPIIPVIPQQAAPQTPNAFFVEEAESQGNSQNPTPNTTHLQTPPIPTVFDPQEDPSLTETPSRHRLSTVAEEPSGEEDNNPIPVPVLGGYEPAYATSVVTSVALPIPNPLTLQHPWHSPAKSDPDDLLTPNTVNQTLDRRSDDELGTPQTQLSPLTAIPHLRQEFGVQQALSSPAPDPQTEPLPVPNPTSLANYPILLPPSSKQNPIPPAEVVTSPSEALSDISVVGRPQLKSRADELRRQAKEEEQKRFSLEEQLKLALAESRPKDALFIKGQIEAAEALARKLHERAARRHYHGTSICLLSPV